MTFNSNHLCEYYHLFSTPFKSEGEKWHPMRQKIRVKKMEDKSNKERWTGGDKRSGEEKIPDAKSFAIKRP